MVFCGEISDRIKFMEQLSVSIEISGENLLAHKKGNSYTKNISRESMVDRGEDSVGVFPTTLRGSCYGSYRWVFMER